MVEPSPQDAPVIAIRQGAIVSLYLNRPERRNAMSAALVHNLIDRLNILTADPAIGTVVLAGSGEIFCAGSDLRDLAAMTPAERSIFEADSGRLARTIAAMPIPIIAAVQKFAIGGGLTLAAACDIVVATPETRCSLPEVPIGLFPAWGLWAVEARIGRARARRLSWGIDTLDGKEAHAIGLVDILDAAPIERATAIGMQLATLGRQEMAQVKSYFSRTSDEEADDWKANRLFLEATESAAAQATFERFGENSAC